MAIGRRFLGIAQVRYWGYSWTLTQFDECVDSARVVRVPAYHDSTASLVPDKVFHSLYWKKSNQFNCFLFISELIPLAFHCLTCHFGPDLWAVLMRTSHCSKNASKSPELQRSQGWTSMLVLVSDWFAFLACLMIHKLWIISRES